MFFRIAANGLHRSETSLGGSLRKIKAKLGSPKAITGTARKIATIFYSMLTQGKEYVEVGLDYYEKRYRERLVTGLKRKAAQLGFSLSPSILPNKSKELKMWESSHLYGSYLRESLLSTQRVRIFFRCRQFADDFKLTIIQKTY